LWLNLSEGGMPSKSSAAGRPDLIALSKNLNKSLILGIGMLFLPDSQKIRKIFMKKSEILENLRVSIAKRYPSGLVARQKIDQATDFILHSRTLANLDCLGTGIKNPVRIGRRIFYKTDEILKFIDQRLVFEKKELVK
jgi:hypothetical protein